MKQYRLVDAAKAAVDASVFIEDVLFVNDKDKPVNVTGGSASTPYVLPAAAENALGGVKLANVTISGTANASVAAAASTAPTKEGMTRSSAPTTIWRSESMRLWLVLWLLAW